MGRQRENVDSDELAWASPCPSSPTWSWTQQLGNISLSFFFSPLVKVQPGRALSTRLVSKVETMVDLDRLRLACQRLDFVPATSPAISVPDRRTHATCSPGRSHSCPGLAAWQPWSAPRSGGIGRWHSEVSGSNPPGEMGRPRPERGGDLPQVTQVFNNITGFARPDRPGF